MRFALAFLKSSYILTIEHTFNRFLLGRDNERSLRYILRR